MKKLLSLTTILACASCLGAYASAENPGGGGILSFGVFYGAALDDLYDDAVDGVNIFGLKVDYELPSVVSDSTFSLAPFFESMIGGGYDDGNSVYYYYNGRYGHTDLDVYVLHWTLAVGPRIRCQVSEKFALTANAKVGLDVEYLDIDADSGIPEKDDTAVGFLWGAGVAGEFQISKRWGLFLGVDYLSSSAQPKLSTPYGKAEDQSFIVVSFGANVRF